MSWTDRFVARAPIGPQRPSAEVGIEACYGVTVVHRPDDQVAVVRRRYNGRRSQQRHTRDVLVVSHVPLVPAAGTVRDGVVVVVVVVVTWQVRVDANDSAPASSDDVARWTHDR